MVPEALYLTTEEARQVLEPLCARLARLLLCCRTALVRWCKAALRPCALSGVPLPPPPT